MAATVITRGHVSGLENKDFEKLAVPLLDGLYNFACWLSGDADEARDLVQETFVKSLKGFSSFREGTNFRAWIAALLLGLAATNAGRAQEDTLQIDVTTDKHGHDGPLCIPLSVPAAWAKLGGQPESPLLLCDVEEMKYQEISEALDIPMGTVMSRLARARRQVRDYIVATTGRKKIVGIRS